MFRRVLYQFIVAAIARPRELNRYAAMGLFPTFNVTERDIDDSGAALVGFVSSTQFGGETWVADQYFGYLKHGDSMFHGSWHVAGNNWKFAVDRAQSLPESNEFEVLDGDWGERAEIVLDTHTAWHSENWQAQDDHDHCAICWATIASFENQAHFVASTGQRVCTSCYQAFVSIRALTFIPVAA